MTPVRTHRTQPRARRSRRAATILAALSLAGGALLWGATASTATTTASSGAPATATRASFPGTGLGRIPDGVDTNCPAAGAPLDVTFAVSGMAHRPLTDVRVTGLTFEPRHSFVGDLRVTLVAPDSTSFLIFGNTGGVSGAENGDASEVAGPYEFADDATGGWWAAAEAALADEAIPSGSYRTSEHGGPGATGADTDLTAAFAGVGDLNGTWTLRFIDACKGDTGWVSAVSLGLAVTPPDCSAQQVAVTDASAAVTAATAVEDRAQAAADAADTALNTARAKATAAHVTQATAQNKANAARSAVERATAQLKKAVTKLRKARRSHQPDRIKRAKITKAKQKRKAARAALKLARPALASALADLATATAQAATADADLAAAQQTASAKYTALTAAQKARLAAVAGLAVAQIHLANCQASRHG